MFWIPNWRHRRRGEASSTSSQSRTTSPSGEHAGHASSADRADGTLQPDASFGANPWIYCAHSLLVGILMLVSVSAQLTSLPLGSRAGARWELILVPLGVAVVVSLCFHVYYIAARKRCVRMQLGPTPDPTTIAAATLQYDFLWTGFMRQHVASNVSEIVVLLGLGISVLLLGLQVKDHGPVAWRICVQPAAVGGLLALCINTFYRLRRRGSVPSLSAKSDFLIIFIYLAAYKLDGEISLPWGVVFIFAFWWVSGFVLLGLSMFIIYLFGLRAGLWRRADGCARLGIAIAHLNFVYILAAFVYLFRFLSRGADMTDPHSASQLATSLRLVIAWLASSAVTSVVILIGQRARECTREAQIAAGRTWTAAFGAGHSIYGANGVVQQVDAMSADEVIAKAREAMASYTKPASLHRIDSHLWSCEPRLAHTDTDAASCEIGKLGDEGHGVNVAVPLRVPTVCAAYGVTELAKLPMEAKAAATPDGSAAVRVTVDEDTACLICFEKVGNHVLMNCGHGGYCEFCAHKMFVRPPNLCPACRGPLAGVVRVDLGTEIGQCSSVA